MGIILSDQGQSAEWLYVGWFVIPGPLAAFLLVVFGGITFSRVLRSHNHYDSFNRCSHGLISCRMTIKKVHADSIITLSDRNHTRSLHNRRS